MAGNAFFPGKVLEFPFIGFFHLLQTADEFLPITLKSCSLNLTAIPLDEPIDIGEPLDEDKLKSISTIYRVDGDKYRDDKDAVEVLHKIHLTRTQGGYNPE